MRNFSHSRMKSARACQRLHHLEYDLGYEPVREDDVLRFGRLFHLGQEAWWKALQAGKRGAELLDAALEAMAVEADLFDKARAGALMAGYHTRWEAEPYKVLAVEQRFEMPLRNPATGAASRTWQLVGQLDVVVEDLRDHRVLVVEHKTSSEDVSPGSEYWKRLRMDGQVSVYFDGAVSLEYDVDSCLYDVVGKPALRPSQVPLLDDAGEKVVTDQAGTRVRTKDGKRWRQTGDSALGYVLRTRDETAGEFYARLVEAIAVAPDRYFARGEVVRLEAELDEARFDAWQLAQQLNEAKLVERYPRNVDSCVRYGRTCPFFDVCSGAASLEDERLFTRRKPKEEAANAVDTAATEAHGTTPTVEDAPRQAG